MTKISTYNIDDNVTANDKWIGSDVNNFNKTKNFTPKKLAIYFNGSQVINTGMELLYKYFTITPPETRPVGTISFENEIGPVVSFSSITTFLISKYTQKGNEVNEFLGFLVGTKSLLYKADDVNVFGYYDIVSIDPYIDDNNFYVVTLLFIEGNGSIEEDKDYMISMIDSNTAEAQDLQSVTDLGATTTNTIIIDSANYYSSLGPDAVGTENKDTGTYTYIGADGVLGIKNETVESQLKNTDVTSSSVILEFPNKASGSYTIATTDDVPATPGLQQVTDEGSTTTNSITAESFIKQDGTGENILLDDGSTIPLTDVGNQDLQSVLENGYTAYDQGIHLITNDIGSNILNLDVSTSEGTYKAIKVDYNYQNEYGSTAVQFTSNGQLNVDEMTTGITLQSNNTSTGNAIEAYSLNGKSIVTYGEGTVAIESNLGTSGKGLVINSGTSSTGVPLTINKNGVDKLVVNQNGELTATKLIKEGGDGTNILLDNGNTLAVSAIPTVTPSALTKVDDTNVTVTLGGSPSTSLLQGVSLTLGWTGTLADSRIASASTWNAKENVLTFSSPLSRSVNTVSMPAATTSVDGYLTSTNWNTFNNKENSLGNPAQDGYVLSSTTTGTRSWVAQAAGFEANFLLMGA